tara:strand:- start:230 stop:925 length:696 start_codon:yes stop_codon:yes gene_type:complete
MKRNFLKVVEKDFDIVNSLIIEYLESDVGLVENIGHYIVDAGGKRFRPLLVLLSALANGYKGADHTKMAVIVEFIHTATLLHDDVVDVASLRRGRQTANIQWGNAPSVLVGDFLYSRAFQLLVQVADMSIMRVMADATNVISEGEVKQMSNAGNDELTEITYRDVIYRKTAKLFEAACVSVQFSLMWRRLTCWSLVNIWGWRFKSLTIYLIIKELGKLLARTLVVIWLKGR